MIFKESAIYTNLELDRIHGVVELPAHGDMHDRDKVIKDMDFDLLTASIGPEYTKSGWLMCCWDKEDR